MFSKPKISFVMTEKDILSDIAQFKLSLSHDGSGKGAALTAAVSLRLRNLKMTTSGEENGKNLATQTISVKA